MADSDNNNEIIGFIASTVETMRDDVALMRAEMVTKNAFDVAITAVRGDIEQVQLRLDSMDHALASRFKNVEGELSRLRSAVSLLGKDIPMFCGSSVEQIPKSFQQN